jgi:1-acyl-sn-glycerol-3-phosphate acyltransferase
VSLYTFARAVLVFLCRVFFRTEVVGKDRVPRTGAFVLAPTHRSGFDIPFAATVTRRTLRYLAKEELFGSRIGAWLFPALGAIAVDRQAADRGALRALEGALKDGSPVVVFPEGTRGKGPVVTPIFGGAAYIAVRANVPIVPLGIGGSEGILRKGALLPRLHKVVVVVGEPLVPRVNEGERRRVEVDALTARLQGALQEAFDEALQRAGVARAASSG